jgi:hypothetical protein
MAGQVNRQPSSRVLAVLVMAANLVVCGGVVAVLGAAHDGSAPAAFTPAMTTTTAEEPPPRDGPPAEPEPGPGSAFTEVDGPGGMTTHIPAGWPATSTADPASMRAEDPAGTTTTLHYGASATPATDTYDAHADHARAFAADQEAYVPVRLARTVVRGAPAVDWEFEYGPAGERRHVWSVHWLSGGHEYFVSASSSVPLWAGTRKILDVMLTYSTP